MSPACGKTWSIVGWSAGARAAMTQGAASCPLRPRRGGSVLCIRSVSEPQRQESDTCDQQSDQQNDVYASSHLCSAVEGLIGVEVVCQAISLNSR